MLKPDAVARNKVGEIISRLERVGLRIVALKMSMVTPEKAKEHYREHKDKSFYHELIDYITSGPVVLMVVEGLNAVEIVRKIAGATDPLKAASGTIRGDFALSVTYNMVHSADSVKSAKREIEIYFPENDFLEYVRLDRKYLE